MPRSKESFERNKKYINSKRNKPCNDCGGIFPECCMDFHHINEDTKNPYIGRKSLIQVMQKYSIEKIDEELNKCVILCANCHRIRHQT